MQMYCILISSFSKQGKIIGATWILGTSSNSVYCIDHRVFILQLNFYFQDPTIIGAV